MDDDLIVVLPGIMGSTLVKDGIEAWGSSAGAIVRAIRSFGASARQLRLPPDLGDDDPHDGVVPGRLMPDLHVVPGLWSINLGYDALLERVRRIAGADGAGDPPNLLPFPYDWRLSNRLNGRRLKAVVEPALDRLRARGGRFADARITFVCHSMGGLVARWYVEREGGHATTRRLITIGTPHRGALKALAELVNGVRRGFGPLGVDLTSFSRSLPSAYQLLPEYACIAVGGRLLKTTETAIPALDPALVADGARFHAELDAADASAAGAHLLQPIVGIKQPTVTTAAIAGERLELLDVIEGEHERGDATVPRLAATPSALPPGDASISWIAARHGALQRSAAVLDQLEGILTARRVVHRATDVAHVGVLLPEIALAGEAIELEATVDEEVPLMVRVDDEHGARLQRIRLARRDGVHRARLGPLPPGGYVATVGGFGSAGARAARVESPFVVWEAA